MSSNDQRTLCVSIHDVSPHTWPLCKTLVDAVVAVGNIPLTLLVVPHYHRLPFTDTGAYRAWLDGRVAAGDELALHGYVHLDEGRPPQGWWDRYRRRVYTLDEGEFAALGTDEAHRRIEMGWTWFERHGWTPSGFVPPAWLMSGEAWRALESFPFVYATTMRAFHLLSPKRTIASRSLVYAARNPQSRLLSMQWNTLLEHSLDANPLVRVSLHPNDARYPALIRHCQNTLARLVSERRAMTKADFAALSGGRRNQPEFEPMRKSG